MPASKKSANRNKRKATKATKVRLSDLTPKKEPKGGRIQKSMRCPSDTCTAFCIK